MEERLDRHDRQIAAMRDLVHEGLRLAVATRQDLRSPAAAQKRTDQSLRGFIDSMHRGENGHGPAKANS